ncbi:MAG: hypothetical protein ACK2U9_16415, partial [Anaerolineae bacterium]
EHVRIGAFLSTLAEAFIRLRDVKILFLAPSQQSAPVERPVAFVKYEEILFFYSMTEVVPVPEETEVRRLEPVEMLVGSFQIGGRILKSPIATLQNLLLVTKDDYIPVYKATVHHVAKPWLGTFSTSAIQVQRHRLTLTSS